VRLRWHRQHPRRPNTARRGPIRRLITRGPIRRLITRPHVDPASVSRAVPRVYRQTRLAGQDRMTGDTLANRRPSCSRKTRRGESRRISPRRQRLEKICAKSVTASRRFRGVTFWLSGQSGRGVTVESWARIYPFTLGPVAPARGHFFVSTRLICAAVMSFVAVKRR
jgi:hypothetical protein